MSKSNTKFVRSESGGVYRATELNRKSRRLSPISDTEALRHFLETGAGEDQLKSLGLLDLYESVKAEERAKAQAEEKVKAASKAKPQAPETKQ